MANEVEDSLTYRFSEKIFNANPSNSNQAMLAAKRGLIDFIASGFSGKGHPGVSKLLSLISDEGGKEVVPLLGLNRRVTDLQAALVNGFIGHAIDFDDVHSSVRGHPSTVILPALISASSSSANLHITGQKFLEAYVVGVEIMARLGESIGTRHYLRGWHNTYTLGTLGATAAISYLKGFTAKQIAVAIGFAATQAAGMRKQFGTEAKPLHAGLAAQAALRAAKFVEFQLGGTETIFEGEIGFFELYGEGANKAESFLLNNWGENWKIVKPGLWFKIYPFCSAAHHAADAALELKNKYGLKSKSIKNILVYFPPNGDAALIQRQPKTGEQGRFSVEYVVALAFCGYPLTLESFQNKEISLEVKKLMEKTKRGYDAKIEPAQNSIPAGRFTIVQVETYEGQIYNARVDCPKGAPGSELSFSELRQKLENSGISHELAEKLFIDINRMTSEEDLKEFLEEL